MSFLRQQLAQNKTSVIGLRRVELRFLADFDSPIFKTGQHFTFGGRLQSLILQLTDDRIFLDLEDNDLPPPHSNFNVDLGRERIKKPHLQDRMQVILRLSEVERFLRFTLYIVENRFTGNAAVATDLHILNDGFSLRRLIRLIRRCSLRVCLSMKYMYG